MKLCRRHVELCLSEIQNGELKPRADFFDLVLNPIVTQRNTEEDLEKNYSEIEDNCPTFPDSFLFYPWGVVVLSPNRRAINHRQPRSIRW